MQCVLAGDIGATNARLLFASAQTGAVLHEAELRSADYPSASAVLHAFVQGLPRGLQAFVPRAIVLGLPGPVLEQEVRTTNLPWTVSARSLQNEFGTPVRLLNDLQAIAIGSRRVGPESLHTLAPGLSRQGHVAVLAAGTGLGQAILVWNGKEYHAMATEGGHADFTPADDRDLRLLHWLRAQFGHASWERLLSGPGLTNLARFLVEHEQMQPSAEVAAVLAGGASDVSTVLGPAAVQGSCPVAVEAARWFARLWGTHAGNVALTTLALGGVLLAGGLARHLKPFLMQEGFMQAFVRKGRMGALLAEVPVDILLDPHAGRLGALSVAQGMALGVAT